MFYSLFAYHDAGECEKGIIVKLIWIANGEV